MLCAKFDLMIGPVILEKKIFKFRQCILLLRSHLPLKKGMALRLNKHESPSPKDAMCQIWLNLAQRFWRRRFLNFVNVFSLFRNYLPLEKGGTLHLYMYLNLFTQGCFVSSLVESGPVVLEKKIF